MTTAYYEIIVERQGKYTGTVSMKTYGVEENVIWESREQAEKFAAELRKNREVRSAVVIFTYNP